MKKRIGLQRWSFDRTSLQVVLGPGDLPREHRMPAIAPTERAIELLHKPAASRGTGRGEAAMEDNVVGLQSL